MPNSIPIDGSTINVWVDGLLLGHPVYNNYRADIATLFPGYANSNGAVGVFSLDTTGYANGVHTIEWSATDTAGNTDGIGSRYFTIQNLSSAPENAAAVGMQANEKSQNTVVEETAGFNLKNAAKRRGIGQEADYSNRAGTPDFPRSINRQVSEIQGMPDDIQTPVFVKRGMAADVPAEIVLPDPDGMIRITIPEVTRLAIYLNERDASETETEMIERGKRMREKAPRYEAYQLVGDELRPLPIGSSFDPETGAFYWQPGPGFLGEFRFVIVASAAKSKKTIIVKIF
jgi:hypothetical protein